MTTKNKKTKIDKVRVCTLEGLMREIDPELPGKVAAMEQRCSMGREIVQRRVVAGLTQTELARRIGCTQSRISKLERSENDKISMVDFMKCVAATSIRGKNISSPASISQQITLVNWGKLSNYLERLIEAAPCPPQAKERRKRKTALA